VPNLSAAKVCGKVSMLKIMWVVHHWELCRETILKRKMNYVDRFAQQHSIVKGLLTPESRYEWKQN
jgi:hypothetical protein